MKRKTITFTISTFALAIVVFNNLVQLLDKFKQVGLTNDLIWSFVFVLIAVSVYSIDN